MQTTFSLARRAGFLLFLLLLLVAGCGSSSETVITSGQAPAAGTATIEVQSVLAKTVPTYVTDFRFSGLDAQSRRLYGPVTVAKSSKVVLTEVPVPTVTLRIEYLANEQLVGSFETPVALRAGELLVITAPEWTAAPVASVNLSPQATVAVGDGPLCLTHADFDQDGEIDLATSDTRSGTLSVALGLGDGEFAPAVAYAAGPIPSALAADDLNGDGYPDLVSANFGGGDDPGNLTVHLNRGDGSFSEAVALLAGDGPTSVALGDFNGDGLLDIACANFRDGTISIFLGLGEGRFSEPSSFEATYRCRSLAIGDLNEDGHADIAIANEGEPGEGDLSLLLGDGRGGFVEGGVYPAGGSPHGVALADLDGDGHLDVAVVNFVSNDVSVLLGRGDGRLGETVNYLTGDIPLNVVIGDFNLDGRLDLGIALGGQGAVSLLTGRGDGTFNRYTAFKAGTRTFHVTSADFNFDGRPDIAAANFGSNDISVLLNLAP